MPIPRVNRRLWLVREVRREEQGPCERGRGPHWRSRWGRCRRRAEYLWDPLALLELVGVKLEVEDAAGSIQRPDAPVRCLDPALVVELVELLLALLK